MRKTPCEPRCSAYGTPIFWIELGLLAAYLVPALLLGLVLRRPVMRLTAWMEDELEATQVM